MLAAVATPARLDTPDTPDTPAALDTADAAAPPDLPAALVALEGGHDVWLGKDGIGVAGGRGRFERY